VKISIVAEDWFKNAPYYQVKMLGIKHLGIEATKFETKQPEGFKRALVRQVFVKSFDFGEEFDIRDEQNPFGAAPKRNKPGTVCAGEYRYAKSGLRAPDTDIRWEMDEVMRENTTFEEAEAEWKKRHGSHKFEIGKMQVSFAMQFAWALRRGWIIKV